MADATLVTLRSTDFIGDSAPVVAGDAPATLEAIRQRLVLAFDDTDEEAAISLPFVMPSTYAGGNTLLARLKGFFASETTATDEAVMDVRIEAITPGDSVDVDAGDSFDSANTAEVDPPGTAGHQVEQDVTMSNDDSVAAGDECRLLMRRDVDDAADTASGDFYVETVELVEQT